MRAATTSRRSRRAADTRGRGRRAGFWLVWLVGWLVRHRHARRTTPSSTSGVSVVASVAMAIRLSLCIVVIGMALPCANLFAQSGLIVQGGYLGANFVLRAGDVDDDGQEDRILYLGSTWEVHSGATGLPFPLLTRSRVAGDLFIGLRADLDADGCDDLCYQVPGSGAAEFLSGRDGSLLFAFSHANLGYVQGAADHDQDGWDDVMVVW